MALALGLMLTEFLIHKLNHDDSYDARETAASLAIAIGNKAIAALTAGVTAVPLMFVYRHRLFDIPLNTVWTWAALFLGVEFSYYVHHVAMHRMRWFWATHAVHHSPTRLNLSAAVRLGWGAHLTGGFLFYVPLIAIGFNPVAVFGLLSAGLVYQFFLHMAHPPQLGPLEWVLNTPRHHQVHHASNPSCLDKNFGAVVIIFDRLFGTFAAAPKDEPMRFGVAGVAPSTNPLDIVFAAWLRMFSEMLRPRASAPNCARCLHRRRKRCQSGSPSAFSYSRDLRLNFCVIPGYPRIQPPGLSTGTAGCFSPDNCPNRRRTVCWESENALNIRKNLVGVAGFEPATPTSRTWCATRLRYTPTVGGLITPARLKPQA
jgi:sterol desaturase/sphingolipid hydroxylase (fatty acid hydroxylase superfamily)